MTSSRKLESEPSSPALLVLLASALVLLIASMDLVGWWFDIPLLTSVFHGYATMKPNTAACLGLLAIALLLSPGPSLSKGWKHVLGLAAAWLSLILSSLTLLEYISGQNLSLDQVLARVHPDEFADPTGRMAIGTSICLALTGLAAVTRDSVRRLSSGVTLVALVGSVSGLLGFIFQAGPLTQVPWLRSLAVHTAAGLALLQLSVLASRPRNEPFFSLSQQWLSEGRRRYLLIAIVFLPVLLGIPILHGLRRGHYDAAFAIALLLVLLMIVQLAIFWADNRTLARVEHQLRKSEAYSSRILASIGDAVIVTDAEGSVTRMNPVAEELTGWTLAEANSSPLARIFKIFNEHTRETVENPVEKVKRFGTIVGLANHTILERQDGGITHIDDSSAPIFEDDGSLSGIVLVFRNVDERKQAERQMKATDERLQIALEAAQLGSWELELANMEMRCSAICKGNFGRQTDQEFSYADLISSIHPEDLEVMQTAISQAIANGSVYRAEYRTLWPDGTLHWAIASGRTLCDDSGKAIAMVGVTMDVTERHQAAAALIQSEKLAAVGRLASSIAHEINNPLESVTNLLYLARQSANDPDVREYLDDAERELRRVAVISSQTLRFYKQATKPLFAHASELIENVLLVYQGKLLNSKVNVEYRDRASQPVLCFDGEVRQVLSNLVGNAIDSMAGRGGRLLLRSHEGSNWKSGRHGIWITVGDTGTGISPEIQKRIFEPFFSTKGLAGTGLGLWISAEIVERHHGELKVRSRQGVACSGTVFSLFLPFEAVERSPSVT